MNINVTFEENAQSFDVDFEEAKQDFDVGFGEVLDLSEMEREEAYKEGYEAGRKSTNLLSSLDFVNNGAYYGKSLDLFGDQKLIMLVTLKKGKTVPTSYFGVIYQATSGGTSAAWTVSSGKYNTNLSVQRIVPSGYSWSMVGCYPGNQETWDAFMDAFDVRVEPIEQEI